MQSLKTAIPEPKATFRLTAPSLSFTFAYVLWRCSSVGQSMRLISAVSGVRLPAPPKKPHRIRAFGSSSACCPKLLPKKDTEDEPKPPFSHVPILPDPIQIRLSVPPLSASCPTSCRRQARISLFSPNTLSGPLWPRKRKSSIKGKIFVEKI